MVENSFFFKDVEIKTSLFNLNNLTIKDIIFQVNEDLFNDRKELYPERNSGELYEETISIVTDMLYLFLSGQRKLNNIYEVTDITLNFIDHIQKNVSELGYNKITNELWNSNTIESIFYVYNFFGSNFLDVEVLSYLVEDTWEKNVETNSASKQGSSKSRRENGSYYTKKELIEVVVSNVLKPLFEGKNIRDLLKLRIIDPSVGSAAFLREALNQLFNQITLKSTSSSTLQKKELKKEIVTNCLFGIDLNTNALKTSVYSLWLDIGDKNLDLRLIEKNFIEGDSLLGMHWNVDLKNTNKEVLKIANNYLVGTLILKRKLLNWDCVLDKVLNKQIPKSDEEKLTINVGENSKTFLWKIEFQNVFEKNNGFDAVIGNPPWNKIKSHIKEYFEHFDQNVKSMQGENLKKYIEKEYLSKDHYRKGWENHQEEVNRYAETIRQIPHFSNQTLILNGKKLGGDLDLYKFFLELSYLICKSNGYVGFIIPATFTQSEGTTGLRKLLLKKTQIELLLTVENRDKLFPIDSRFKYAILIFKKGKTYKKTIKCSFMLNSIKEVQETVNNNNFIDLPVSLFEMMSPSYETIPDFKSKFEVDLLKKIYESHPLINSENGWKIEFKRELDMTNNSDLFIHKDKVEFKKNYVPLYEGRMVYQFDYAAKKYLNGEARRAMWEDLRWDDKDIVPHYYLKVDDAKKQFPNYDKTRVGFCDIAGQTNQRSVQTALLPGETISGNKVPTVKFEKDNIAIKLLWIAITNSFVFDWLMRLRISTTINFFHWNQIPMPVLDTFSSEAKYLIKLSAKLSFITGHTNKDKEELLCYYKGELTENDISPSLDPRERQYLRAKIDALIAKLYGVDLSELSYILHQFPLLDKKQPILKGDLNTKGKEKSYITRDLVLYNYLLLNNLDTSLSINMIYKYCNIEIHKVTGEVTSLEDRVKQYDKLNAIGYLPG